MKPVRQKKNRKPVSEAAVVERLYKTVHQTKRIVRRWVAGAEATISTNGSGLVALATLANSAVISSAPDFASLAVLYTAYRCQAIRVQILSRFPQAVWNGTTVSYPPSAVAVYPWTSNSVPTTFAQALDVTGVKIKSGYQNFVITNSYSGDPDAHLWTGTGSAIGSGEQFGISVVGSTIASSASYPFWHVIPQYLVEFRMNG